MLPEFDIPSDGPEELLVEVARRLGLRYTRSHVRERFAREAQPGSLLALKNVASSLGLEFKAGETDLETLSTLDADTLPLILHFQSAGRAGFGLLEALSPPSAESSGRFRLWDSQRGRREVGADVLGAHWSGVMVLLERGASGEPEPGYLWHRARELLLEEWRLKTALVGPSASRLVRGGLAALLAALLVLAVLAQPPGLRVATAALALLAGAGLAASLAALTWTRGGKASFLCGVSGPFDCGSILRSAWARPAGVPLAGLGAAFFGALLLLLCGAALGGGVAPAWLAGAAFLPTLPLSALLLGVQVRMRRFCTLCMGVHAVNLTGAAVFLFGPWPGPPPGLLPAALLLGLLFGLLLSSTMHGLSTGDDASLCREHMLLFQSPLGTLARLSQEPWLELDGETLGPTLGRADAPHVLIVFAHPTCPACGQMLEEVEALVAGHSDRVRVHIALAPRDPDDPRDEAACTALAAAGVAWGGPLFLQLFRAAKRDYARLLRSGDPLALVAADAGRDVTQLAAARETARARVRAAAALQQRHVRALPALFLDGRRCEAPLPHVAAWLSQPALLELLPPGVASQARGPARDQRSSFSVESERSTRDAREP